MAVQNARSRYRTDSLCSHPLKQHAYQISLTPDAFPDQGMMMQSLRFHRRTHAGTSEFRASFSPSDAPSVYASTIPIDNFSTRCDLDIALSRSPELAGSTLSDQIAASPYILASTTAYIAKI